MKKFSLIFLLLVTLLSSCADDKTLILNGREKTFEPYGWIDVHDVKNDSISYTVCAQNIVWDVILSETLIFPILCTGYELYEPDHVKVEFVTNDYRKK